MRLLACSLILAAGCTDSSRAPDATVARECIRTIDSGPTVPSGPYAIVLTRACTDTAYIDNIQLYDGALSPVMSFAKTGERYRATRIAQLDGENQIDIVGLNDTGSAYVGWINQHYPEGTHVDYARPFDDLAVADLDRDQKPDVIVAGDDAIRVRLGTGSQPSLVAPNDERVLLTGKPFRNVAVTAKGEIYYLAQAFGGSTVELGVARATLADPLAFTATTLATFAAGDARVLSLADVDGDLVPDAIGTGQDLFVANGRTGAVSFLAEGALAVAAGDIDADTHAEPIFLAADGRSVGRVHVAFDGSLTAEPLFDTHAQALAVSDFDSNGIADIAVVDRIGTAGSTVSLYRY